MEARSHKDDPKAKSTKKAKKPPPPVADDDASESDDSEEDDSDSEEEEKLDAEVSLAPALPISDSSARAHILWRSSPPTHRRRAAGHHNRALSERGAHGVAPRGICAAGRPAAHAR